METVLDEVVISGVPICKGVVTGKLYLLLNEELEVPHVSVSVEEIEGEVKRYRQALKKAQVDIRSLLKKLKTEKGEEASSILEAHLEMMRDPLFVEDIEKEIRSLKKNAEFVFHQILEAYKARFSMVSDPFFRERIRDVDDIKGRIMGHLMMRPRGLKELPAGAIVYVKDLTPSLVAEAIQCGVAGILSEAGGSTSHAAIVARSKGLPYVSSIPYEQLQDFGNALAVLDGRKGEIILHPVDTTLDGYELIKSEIESQAAELEHIGALKSETYDGYQIGLSANIDVDAELELLHQFGGKGIGLYRSEFVFLSHQEFPSEEEQYLKYKGIIEGLKGLPIIIRTFDVGGDKGVLSLNGFKKNSFLGCRAIRFLFKEQDVFRTQIRAILRAGHKGKVSIMFPMISSLSELLDAKELVKEVHRELKKQKVPCAQKIKIGCMIEVPSAAMIADLLARESDFLAIGTNDLVQYSLAVDRADQSLSEFYTPSHPGILRMIKMVVRAANLYGIPVSVCGEVAADPRYIALLIGLGIRELSVAVRFLPDIKRAIRNCSIISAIQLADKALSLDCSKEIDELLDREFNKIP